LPRSQASRKAYLPDRLRRTTGANNTSFPHNSNILSRLVGVAGDVTQSVKLGPDLSDHRIVSGQVLRELGDERLEFIVAHAAKRDAPPSYRLSTDAIVLFPQV
jgi:hypothetical protein